MSTTHGFLGRPEPFAGVLFCYIATLAYNTLFSRALENRSVTSRAPDSRAARGVELRRHGQKRPKRPRRHTLTSLCCLVWCVCFISSVPAPFLLYPPAPKQRNTQHSCRKKTTNTTNKRAFLAMRRDLTECVCVFVGEGGRDDARSAPGSGSGTSFIVEFCSNSFVFRIFIYSNGTKRTMCVSLGGGGVPASPRQPG